jgi:hypothetical protein
MFGALAQAVPTRVPADGSGGSTLPTIAGYRDGKPFVFCETSWAPGVELRIMTGRREYRT